MQIEVFSQLAPIVVLTTVGVGITPNGTLFIYNFKLAPVIVYVGFLFITNKNIYRSAQSLNPALFHPTLVVPYPYPPNVFQPS